MGMSCPGLQIVLAPPSKKNSPKIDTPFYKWANFLYLVLEFALKLIPRSRNGPIFYTPFYGATRVQHLLVNALNRIFKSNLSLNRKSQMAAYKTGAFVRSKYCTPF